MHIARMRGFRMHTCCQGTLVTLCWLTVTCRICAISFAAFVHSVFAILLACSSFHRTVCGIFEPVLLNASTPYLTPAFLLLVSYHPTLPASNNFCPSLSVLTGGFSNPVRNSMVATVGWVQDELLRLMT
jgi:hypothetical protein